MPKLTSAQQTRILIKLDDAQRAVDDILGNLKTAQRKGADLVALQVVEAARQQLGRLRLELVRTPMMRGARAH